MTFFANFVHLYHRLQWNDGCSHIKSSITLFAIILKPHEWSFLASTIFVLEVIIISQEDHANQLI